MLISHSKMFIHPKQAWSKYPVHMCHYFIFTQGLFVTCLFLLNLLTQLIPQMYVQMTLWCITQGCGLSKLLFQIVTQLLLIPFKSKCLLSQFHPNPNDTWWNHIICPIQTLPAPHYVPASASQEKGTFHIPLNGIASHNELEQSHLIVRAIVHNLNVYELQ